MKSVPTDTFGLNLPLLVLASLAVAILSAANPTVAQSSRERLSMDYGWRFHLGNAADTAGDFGYGGGRAFAKTGPSRRGMNPMSPAFDDSNWRLIDVPHDWAVELEFDPRADRSHGFKAIGRQWPANSVGWYRKTFDLPASDQGKRLAVEFDGVFRDSMAWLNGHLLGRNLSGYTSFRYDISDVANYGGENTLVIRVDASIFEGWFYEGAGIYRHTWLVKTAPVHVGHWGTFVSSTVNEDGASAQVRVRTTVANESEERVRCQVVSTILDADGNVVAEEQSNRVNLRSWRSRRTVQNITVGHPHLWSLESPYLYRLVTTVKQGDETLDAYETPFGIRTVAFDADEGFFLNGKAMKIKGVCCHHDHAGVGSALPDRLNAFRIERLKEMGVNAYRCSHNPPTPELLDACDRLGMLVLDEHRMMGSSNEILSQLASVVRRDRNHPSVFMWCVGNEEMAIQATDIGTRIITSMKRTVNRLDPTRLITVADNNVNDSWGSEFSLVGDVLGCNYFRLGDADEFHRKFSDRPIVGSENASTQTTRGIYENDAVKGFTNAYGTTLPNWGRSPEDTWSYVAQRPFLAGVFLWTGFDYRGEPSPFSWPCINSHYGIMDVCAFPKDGYYYYQAWWTDQTVLHIFPHWNWAGKGGEKINVWCYSNCDEVELSLNGNSLGRRAMPPYGHLEWDVAYAPGTLQATGYKDGQQVGVKTIETTGPPAQIKLTPDRTMIHADNDDVSVITVAILDDQGRIVPTADNLVRFRISDNAKIIGVGNGNPSSHEPDKAHQRRAFNGLCQVIIQSGPNEGTIRFSASSPGLQRTRVIINAQAAAHRPFVPSVQE